MTNNHNTPQNPFGGQNNQPPNNQPQNNQYGQYENQQGDQFGAQNNPNNQQFGNPNAQPGQPGSGDQFGGAAYGQTPGPEKKSPALKILAIVGALVLFLGIGFAYNAYKDSNADNQTSASDTADSVDFNDNNDSDSNGSDSDSTTDPSEGTTTIRDLTARNQFAVGDCFSQNGNDRFNPNSPRVDLVDCDDDDAILEVLSEYKNSGDTSCLDTAGGVTTIPGEGGSVLCLGESYVDPESTINLAKAGDCIKESPGANNAGFEKVDCSESGSHRVLGTVDDGPGRDEQMSQEHFRFCTEAGHDDATYLFTLYVPVVSPTGGEQSFDVRTYCAV